MPTVRLRRAYSRIRPLTLRGLSGFTTTVLLTWQTISPSTAKRAYAVNQVVYDQTLANTQLDSSLNATEVATRPFRDAAARGDLIAKLTNRIPLYTTVQKSLPVPIVPTTGGPPSTTAASDVSAAAPGGSSGISAGAVAGTVVGAVVAIAAVAAAQ